MKSVLRFLVLIDLMIITQQGKAQFLIEMIDTSQAAGKGLLSVFKKMDHIRITGYIQPQFQVTREKGTKTYNGGDFAPNSDHRFMLRRGRIRFEYAHFNERSQPSVQFVFQFDGTERGVAIRDFWGRIYENRWQLFSITSGMFARPFGYELNLSSSDRESPERGRMSQIHLRTERDLGVMASFDARAKNHPLRFLKMDLGIFNGQGLTGPHEFDSYKDIIGHAGLKPYPISKNMSLSAGASFLRGGFIQNSKYVYQISRVNDHAIFVVDSSESNLGKKAPRRYYSIDAQLKIANNWGDTEVRGEYWWGTQTATANSAETPGLLLNEPYYIRSFNGAFFYFLQFIVNKKHQIGIKYDWYDPNTDVKRRNIGTPGTNTSLADIKFNTVSIGYNYYMKDNFKLMFWYDIVRNEQTLFDEYKGDIKDNVLTCRFQFRF